MNAKANQTRSRAPSDDLFTFRLDQKCLLTPGAKRRKREREATPSSFDDFDRFVLAEAAEACARRQAMTGYEWQVDHMIPLRRGGQHTWWNIQVIPERLNSRKQDRLLYTEPGEWVRDLPGAAGLF